MNGDESLRTKDLVSRLRQRLITVPDPKHEPFKPMYPIFHHHLPNAKAGDYAGISVFDANIDAAGAGNMVARHMIFAVDPLCEEAAKALEELQEYKFMYEGLCK